MLKAIWNDKSGIGRLEYFKNSMLIPFVVIPFFIPNVFSEAYESIGQPFSPFVNLGCGIVALIGLALLAVLISKNIFKRARNLENLQNINRAKWFFLSFFPFVAIYGQFCLLFKKAKNS